MQQDGRSDLNASFRGFRGVLCLDGTSNVDRGVYILRLYKVLDEKGGRLFSPYQSMEYVLGKRYTCTDFDTNPKEDCSRGFYATDIDGLPYAFRVGKTIVECEVGGKQVEYNQFKRRYEHIEALRIVPTEEIKALALGEESKVGYKLCEVLYPVNPLLLPAKKEILTPQIELLKQWDSVWASVRASVRDSVWDSVRASVWDSVWDSVWASVRDSVWDSVSASVWASVWDSVWDSVWASVRDSVWDSVWASVRASVWDSVWASVRAYVSSLFPGISNWKYIDHAPGVNPFQPCIDLWHMGLVPSCDGKIWRLHTGEKAEIAYEMEATK